MNFLNNEYGPAIIYTFLFIVVIVWFLCVTGSGYHGPSRKDYE